MSSAATATDEAQPPHVVDECRRVLFVYSDGSVVRTANPSFPAPVHDDGSVEWKDLIFSPTHSLLLRLYRPRDHDHSASKLPIFYYFHGGGFCIGSRTWPNCQNYCLRLASDLQALVIAPDYRLAPEHRLPAAIDDGFAALDWLRSQASSANDIDPWLAESADFSRVFISGDSAGGNMAHHLAFQSDPPENLNPVRVRGYIQLMPFFGGTERTRSEAECPEEAFLNLELNDRFWKLSVPRGATTDHPLVNPFGPESPSLEGAELKAKMMVVVGGKDLLRDRAVEYGERLKGWGKPVEVVEFEGQQHGFFTIEPRSQPADELMGIIKRFIYETNSSSQ